MLYVRMYVCMYVCMYVNVVCTYVCMYVCMYVNVVCTYVCMYVCKCMHVCMYVCMYVCNYVCRYVCMHVCTYVCTYVKTYLCIYVFNIYSPSTTWNILYSPILILSRDGVVHTLSICLSDKLVVDYNIKNNILVVNNMYEIYNMLINNN